MAAPEGIRTPDLRFRKALLSLSNAVQPLAGRLSVHKESVPSCVQGRPERNRTVHASCDPTCDLAGGQVTRGGQAEPMPRDQAHDPLLRRRAAGWREAGRLPPISTCGAWSSGVSGDGRKSWSYRYRTHEGRQARLALGVYPATDLAAAPRICAPHRGGGHRRGWPLRKLPSQPRRRAELLHRRDTPPKEAVGGPGKPAAPTLRESAAASWASGGPPRRLHGWSAPTAAGDAPSSGRSEGPLGVEGGLTAERSAQARVTFRVRLACRIGLPLGPRTMARNVRASPSGSTSRAMSGSASTAAFLASSTS